MPSPQKTPVRPTQAPAQPAPRQATPVRRVLPGEAQWQQAKNAGAQQWQQARQAGNDSRYGGPAQAPGTMPQAGVAAPVGTAARPSPNPITPVRPAAPAGISIGGRQYPATAPQATPSIAIGGRPYSPAPPTPGIAIGGQQFAPTATPPPAPPAQMAQPPTLAPADGVASVTPPPPPAPNPGQALGFSSRGASVPRGSDLTTTGTGPFARQFASPQAEGAYAQYARKLFAGTGAA